MVYECEKCQASLPPGVLACPQCGDNFDDAVPPDAEAPRRGWRSKAAEADSPSPADTPVFTQSPSAAFAPPPPAQTAPANPDSVYWQSKARQVEGIVGGIAASPNGRRLIAFVRTRNGRIAVGVIAAVLVMVYGAGRLIHMAHPLVGAWVSSAGGASITLRFSPLGTFREVLSSDNYGEDESGTYSDDGKHVILQPQSDVMHSAGGTSEESGVHAPVSFAYGIDGDTMTLINSEGVPVIYQRQ